MAPKLIEARTVMDGFTLHKASTEERVASRSPQPEILIGSINNKLSAGNPIIRLAIGASVPYARKQQKKVNINSR